MKTLLRIDSSARREGSHSRALADYFQFRWLQLNPLGRVVLRDLASEPPPHLNDATIADFLSGAQSASTEESHLGLSEVLIAELVEADDLLLSSSLYNFAVPSTLKAYVDHIVRVGRTLRADQSGFHGMLRAKTICILTSRGGGLTPADEDDFHGPYLQKLFHFLGIERQEWIALEGSINPDGKLEERLSHAKEQIDSWLKSSQIQPAQDLIEWRGVFSPRDREEINVLRSAQTRAILNRDAAAYAAICAEDITLMLQGRDLVQGRAAFEECERELLSKTHFSEMKQIPIRVERHGQLAVEIGRQEMATAHGEDESFKARRKYSHVLRKTESGWRFAVLMSNNSI